MEVRVPMTGLVLSGRRLALLCVVWVVLGAGLNVGVAWVCALGLVPLPPTGQPGRVSMLEWPIDVPGPWPDAPRGDLVHVYQPRAVGFGRYRMTWVHHPEGFGDEWGVRASIIRGERSGWPAQALVSYVAWQVWETPGRRWTHGFRTLGLLTSGVGLGVDPVVSRALPLKPNWFGLVANMLLYVPLAAVVSVYGVAWPFVAVRRKWRRARHRKRWRADRCLGCGYDLSGLMPGQLCPECGREKPWPDLSPFPQSE